MKQISHNGADDGFSLLEVTVSLFLGAVFLSSALFVYLSLWNGYNTGDRHVQSLVMAVSLRRLLVQDMHAASQVNAQSHSFSMVVNGQTYRYYINNNGQCIRVRAGGGTTVLADGIDTLTVSVQGTVLSANVLFHDGYQTTIKCSLLSSLSSSALTGTTSRSVS